MLKPDSKIECMFFHGLTIYYRAETDGFNKGIELIKCPVISITYLYVDGVIGCLEILVINAKTIDERNRETMRADDIIGGELVFWIDFYKRGRGLDYNSLVARLKNRILFIKNRSLLLDGAGK